jgi:hypothetical protein
MLLVITIKPTGEIHLNSDDANKTGQAHQAMRDRLFEVAEEWVDGGRKGSQFDLLAALVGRLDARDRALIDALGFSGIAFALPFGGE